MYIFRYIYIHTHIATCCCQEGYRPTPVHLLLLVQKYKYLRSIYIHTCNNVLMLLL